jgi:hypothetical protein
MLVSNFLKMPTPLRFLTGVALLYIFFVTNSALSETISVQGRVISRSEWWGSGSGPIQLLSSLPLIISAFLLLARARYARAAYLSGWLISDIGTGFILKANGLMLTLEHWRFYFLACAISFLVFSGYLLMSNKVAAYIKGELPQPVA